MRVRGRFGFSCFCAHGFTLRVVPDRGMTPGRSAAIRSRAIRLLFLSTGSDARCINASGDFLPRKWVHLWRWRHVLPRRKRGNRGSGANRLEIMDSDNQTNKNIDGAEKPDLILSRPQSMDPLPEGITDEHRNGSITAIGIVLGFSLTFFSSWMNGPEPWDYIGIAILLTLGAGIALQIISLRRLLILPQAPGLRHSVADHNRAVQLFFWGTALVSTGFFLWVLISMVHDLV